MDPIIVDIPDEDRGRLRRVPIGSAMAALLAMAGIADDLEMHELERRRRLAPIIGEPNFQSNADAERQISKAETKRQRKAARRLAARK